MRKLLTAATITGAALLCISCGAEAGVGETLGSDQEALTSISTLQGLRNMNLALGGSYKLTANITMTSSDAPFQSIGSPFSPFTGTFDGGGFTITNLRIGANDGGWYRGLFSATSGATLTRVRLNNVTVQGGGEIAGIVGSMDSTTLTDSYVTGTVTGNGSSVGMVAGMVGSYCQIERCYATGTVGGAASVIGGFVGSVSASGFLDANGNGPPAKISEIFTNVNVNPNTSGVSGDVIAGGLAGEIEGALIHDINVVGPVKGRGKVGGVIGYAHNDSPDATQCQLLNTIFRSSTTDTSGATPAGPVGAITAPFGRCNAYYDSGADSGTPIATGDILCNGGFSATTLKQPHPSPNKLINPFIIGQLVTQQDINAGIFPQCKLASGSDGDWGFGTCGVTQIWALNSSTEHITLTRIPNPSVQPK
jgi:hypothetical protein